MGPTILVGLVLVGILFLALRSLLRSKKAGGCACGCAGCSKASKNACHNIPNPQ